MSFLSPLSLGQVPTLWIRKRNKLLRSKLPQDVTTQKSNSKVCEDLQNEDLMDENPVDEDLVDEHFVDEDLVDVGLMDEGFIDKKVNGLRPCG